ncbi:MAG: hypothetical protein Q9227_003021 [Pyrenula ochraceoflavens]
MPPSSVVADNAVFKAQRDGGCSSLKPVELAMENNSFADNPSENGHEPQPKLSEQARVSQMADDRVVPIAVIGMACRFPQDASSVEAFWRMLTHRQSALSDIPQNRFNSDAFCTSGRPRGGMFNASKAHCLRESLAAFDAPFFSISAEEAVCMDPQQRLLLETAYHAFENVSALAGIPIHTMKGSNTSVYIGSFMHDYEHMLKRDPQMRAQYTAIGNGGSVLANRISWSFDLHGPSLTSLVGGCNVFFDPAEMGDITTMGILSPDGVSRSFDSKANGFSRGEGFGAVVLKRLDDAIKEGDTIRAVIRATGTNSSGRTPGITQPSGTAQAALVRRIYRESGVDPASTTFFEAHGTGTPVGDLFEARAIHEGLDTSLNREPLYIGAVKSNIGHLEGAAGIAGFIKTVLVLEKGLIPANLHFEQPNKKIPSAEWNIKFPTENIIWPTEGLRRASQNSFGFAGANAHAILDDAYHYLRLRGLKGSHRTQKTTPALFVNSQTQSNGTNGMSTTAGGRRHLLVWSAPDEDGLKRLISLHKHHHLELPASKADHSYTADLSHTLVSRRDKFLWRAFGIAASAEELCGHFWDHVSEPIRSGSERQPGFLFTGQGAQWALMGSELSEFAVYRQSLENADSFFRELGSDWSLFDELHQPDTCSRLSRPEYGQPITTALQIAVVDLMLDWGVAPVSVVGHSSGEIAAAYCAGAISRETAWALSWFRGVVSAEVASGSDGTMLSVSLSDSAISHYFDPDVNSDSKHYAAIACINSPQDVTVSGARAKINSLHATFEAAGIPARQLKVEAAYHSQRMENAAAEYKKKIECLFSGFYSELKGTKMFSSVLGREVSAKDLNTSTYWMKSLKQPVRFADAVRIMMLPTEQGISSSKENVFANRPNHLIEIGPHSSLKEYVRKILHQSKEHVSTGYSPVIVRKVNALDTILAVAGRMFCMGCPIDLVKVQKHGSFGYKPTMCVDLPPYPFNHSREYWLEGPQSKAFRFRRHKYHELLGWRVSDPQSPGRESRWQNTISLLETPWISDHRVNNTVVFPGSGMIAMVFEAVRQEISDSETIYSYQISHVELSRAITFSEQESIDVQLTLLVCRENPENSPLQYEFRIFAFHDPQWVQVCNGLVAAECVQKSLELMDGDSNNFISDTSFHHLRKFCDVSVTSEELYQYFKVKGLEYRGPFQRLQDVHISLQNNAIASVDLSGTRFESDCDQTQAYLIHPTALDAIFQTALASLYEDNDGIASAPVISQVNNLRIVSKKLVTNYDGKLDIHAKCLSSGSRTKSASIIAWDPGNDSFELESDLGITHLGDEHVGGDEELSWSQVCSVVKWKPDLDLLSLDEIKKYCSEKVEPGMRASYYALTEEKDRLILASLYTMSQTGLASHNALSQPHFGKYLKWVKTVISRYAQKSGDEDLLNLKRLAEDENSMRELREKVAGSGPDGELIARIHANLSSVLNGEIDALDLMFHDGLLSKAYAAINEDNPAFKQLATYLDALAHKDPNLKILEVGAGTGGATFEILSTLTEGMEETPRYPTSIPRFEEYVFTDISTSFFEKAKERFAAYVNRMSFSLLNIEQDLASQDFAEESFDIVIASNVLHATSDLKRTLQNTRQLLKPGGKLILYELVDPSWLFPCFVSGLLPGWWLSTEKERTWTPLLTAPRWHAYLSETGFAGIDLVFGDGPDGVGEDSLTSVLISTANDTIPRTKISSRFSLILQPESETQLLLAKSLQQALLAEGIAETCELVPIKNIGSIVENETVYLFLPGIEVPVLNHISEHNFQAVKHLIHSARTIFWVYPRDVFSNLYPLHDMVIGLSRVARTENPDLRFTTLALSPSDTAHNTLQQILRVCRRQSWQANDEFEPEYLQKDDKLCISRVTDFGALNQHIKAQNGPSRLIPKILNGECSGAFKPDGNSLTEDIKDSDVEIDVRAIGQSFRVLAQNLDQSDEKTVARGCAGIVFRAGATSKLHVGDRVCCLTTDSTQSRVRCKDVTTTGIPAEMSFETATSIPTDYCVAYIALVYWARVQCGDVVLVDVDSVQLSRALLQLALTYTETVYILVGDHDWKEWSTNLALLPSEHVLSRQTASQPDGLKNLLGDRSIDIVIADSPTTAESPGHECVATFGRLIQIGPQQVAQGSEQAANTMNACVDITRLVQQNPNAVGHALKAVIRHIEEKSLVLHQPAKVLNAGNLQTASLTASQEYPGGDMVSTFNGEEPDSLIQKAPRPVSLDTQATYVIAGGFGGIGRRIARWMTARGGRHILFLSRSGGSSNSARSLLSFLRANGVQVTAPRCDVSNRQQVVEVLHDCTVQMPPIKGCIQAVLVQKPASLNKMSYASYLDILGPKVSGSQNLHDLLPRDLSFFMMLSSMAGIVGQPAQGAYAIANTFQDSLAHHRMALGLPAVSLDLPVMLDDGYVAESPASTAHELLAQGHGYMRRAVFERVLDYFCNSERFPRLRQEECQVVCGLQSPRDVDAQTRRPWFWTRFPLFRHIWIRNSHGQSIRAQKTLSDLADSDGREAPVLGSLSYLTRLQQCPDNAPGQREAIVLEAIRAKVAKHLGLQDPADVDVDAPSMSQRFGIDSLGAVDLRGFMRTELDIIMEVWGILDLVERKSIREFCEAVTPKIGKEVS